MRVIFVNRFFWPDHSATSQLLSDLAFHLATRAFDVVVVTSRQRYDNAAAALPASETRDAVQIVRVWSTRFGRARLVGRAVDYLSFYCSVFAFLLLRSRVGDIVVSKTDPPLLGTLAAAVARVRRIRRVNWLQDIFPEVAQAARLSIAHGLVGRTLQRIRDWSLQGATNVVLGERMAAFIRDRGIQGIEVVPNWADGTAIQPLPVNCNPLRDAWGLTGKFVVCYSGNLGRVHDMTTLLDAAERLQDDAGVVFLFIGGGSQHDRLRIEAKQRDLNNLIFRPYQPRELLGKTLTVPDVHLVSLRPEFEGLVVPSKYYGVAAAGLPCIFIGDPSGEIAQVLRRGASGVTVAPGDGEALARTILRLRNDSEQCAAMGKAARREFDARFDQPIALAKWEALLRGAKAEETG
jgi:colanic acid biosynthesis glycosyl transferase WcaI